MLQQILIEIFERDLAKLKQEIELYKTEEHLWITAGEINNSPGNLTLHILGNLNHFIGAILGKTGYIRNRDAEFSDKYVPKHLILKSIDDTLIIVRKSLIALSEDELTKDYPVHVFEKGMTTAFFLIHLTSHLNYHLGQINYHRRILASDS